VERIRRHVAREHAAGRAEHVDGLVDEGPEALRRPVDHDHTGPGELGAGLGQAREPLHSGPPPLDARLGTIPGKARVADDEGHVVVAGRDCRRRRHLVREYLQIEGEIVVREQAVTPLPGRVVGVVGPIGALEARIVGVSEDVPDAPQVVRFPMRRQRRLRVGGGEIGVGDDAMGKAVPVGHVLAPAGLAHRIRRIPVGLDVHGLHHVVGRAVGTEIVDEVAPAHGGEVAVHARRAGLTQPGVVVVLQIPQVMVRVDLRKRAEFLGHGGVVRSTRKLVLGCAGCVFAAALCGARRIPRNFRLEIRHEDRRRRGHPAGDPV
jgi:hypothetical protein